MSAAESKAVFLSYASQDAEAARRICETLRSSGVEVWFDVEGGLEHGDEWDGKIRKQIKDCVLFIPVISASTQARDEGYFRLEWDLAAERARTIASGVPFILPVVIDDTREPDALVPDRFRMVQWTKLPGGVVTPEVKARYLKLWSHRTGALKQAAVADREHTTGRSQSALADSSGADEKSVTVLPFANQSAEKDNEYFSDGIAEELLTTLQKIPGLRVSARTSAWSFKGQHPTAREVGEKLGMAHVVEGSVQKIGNRVKITARLSRAATNEEVWSQSFGPRELTDVFAMQAELAQLIVGELRGKLTGDTATAAAAKAEIQAHVLAATKGGTKNPEAHQLYLQGRFFAARASPADVARGIDYYEKALAADPAFAIAWAAMARARLWQGSWESLDLARFQQARVAGEKALTLCPGLADAHSVIALLMQRHLFDWRKAREASARAVALAAADADILTDAAWCTLTRGENDHAIELGRRAVLLDPVNAEARLLLAFAFFYSDRLLEAKVEIRRMIELAPKANVAHLVACAILLADGRPEEAFAAAQQEPERMHRLEALALVEFARGRRSESDAALAALKNEFAESCPYQIAEVCGYRRELDDAFAWLEHAWEIRDPGVPLIKVSPMLRNLHLDGRWPGLLRKIGLHDDQLK